MCELARCLATSSYLNADSGVEYLLLTPYPQFIQVVIFNLSVQCDGDTDGRTWVKAFVLQGQTQNRCAISQNSSGGLMFDTYRSGRCAVLNHLKLSVSDGKHRYNMIWTLLL